MCERLHTSAVVQKNGRWPKDPMELAIIWLRAMLGMKKPQPCTAAPPSRGDPLFLCGPTRRFDSILIARACCWLTLTNDPPGAVQEFDRTKLLSVFDAIRDSVKLT